MPEIRRHENDIPTAAGGCSSTNVQAKMPRGTNGEHDRSVWLPAREAYAEFRKHVSKDSIESGNPFDGLRFVKEISNERRDAVCTPFANELRSCYLPYAEEFLHYAESRGWPKDQLAEKYKLIVEICRKTFEDLVSAVIDRKNRSAQVGVSLWDAVAIETMAGLRSDNGVVLFNGFGNMLAFYDNFAHFVSHQSEILNRYAEGRNVACVDSYAEYPKTMQWLAELTRDSTSFQRYYDPQKKHYTDLTLASLPKEGILPLKDINLVAKEAILLVMGSLDVEEGNSKLVVDRIARLHFCHPKGRLYCTGKEILATTALELSLAGPEEVVDFIRENSRKSYPPQAEVGTESLARFLPCAREPRASYLEVVQRIPEIDFILKNASTLSPDRIVQNFKRILQVAVYYALIRENGAAVTSMARKLRLGTSDGRVVFENIAHLLATWTHFAAKVPTQESIHSGLGRFYLSFAEYLGRTKEEKKEFYERMRVPLRISRSGGVANFDLHLPLLGEVRKLLSKWPADQYHLKNEILPATASNQVWKRFQENCVLAMLAIHQAMGSVHGGEATFVAERVSLLRFISADGKYSLLGSAILGAVEAHLSKDSTASLNGVRAIEFIRKLWPTETAVEVAEAKPSVQGIDSYVFEKNLRAPRLGETLCNLAVLDEVLSIKAFRAEEFIANKELKSGDAQYINGANKYLAESISDIRERCVRLIRNFLSLQEVKDRKIFTYEWPNLRLATMRGQVVFESFAHFLASLSNLERELQQERKKVFKYLSGDEIESASIVPWSAMQFIGVATETGKYGNRFGCTIKDYEEKYKHRVKDLPDLHLRSLGRSDLSNFPQPNGSFVQQSSDAGAFSRYLIIAREAIEQVRGSLDGGTAKEVAEDVSKFTFVDKKEGSACTGLDLLAQLEIHSPGSAFNKASGMEVICARAVELLREAYRETSEEAVRGISEVDNQNDIAQTQSESWIDIVKANIRDSEAHETVCRLKSLDEVLKLTMTSSQKFIQDNDLKPSSNDLSWTDNYLSDVISKTEQPLFRVIVDFVRNQGAEDREVYTHEWPNLRLATSDGKVVFESLAHLLASAARLDGEMNFELLQLEAYLSGNKLAKSYEYKNGGWTALEFLAVARDIFGSGPEDAFQDKLRARYFAETRLPDLQLQALGKDFLQTLQRPATDFIDRSSKPDVFACALMTAREAIEQSCGSLTKGTAEEVVDIICKLSFTSEQGPFRKSGADILSTVGMLSPGAKTKKSYGRDDFIRAVEIVRAAFQELNLDQESEALQVVKQRTWSDILKVNIREPAEGEKLCALTALDDALKISALTAEEFMLEKKLKKGDQEYARRCCDRYKKQVFQGFYEPLFEVANEFLRKQGVEKQDVYTYQFADVRFATTDGKVVFESLAHFISSVTELEKKLHIECAILNELLLGNDCNQVVIRTNELCTAMEFLSAARDLSGICEKDYFSKKLKTQYGDKNDLPDLQLRSFSQDLAKFPQPNVELTKQIDTTFYHYLIIAREAIEQVCGSLTRGAAEEVADQLISFKFASVTDERRDTGFDILSSVVTFSPGPKKRKNPNHKDCVAAVEIVRNAYSDQAKVVTANAPILKENVLASLLNNVRNDMREPKSGEVVCKISSLEKLLNFELQDAAGFRRQLIEEKLQLFNGATLLSEYEINVVRLFHDQCELVLGEFLKEREAGDREIYSFEWPDVRLGTSDGRVAFESFGGFLAFLQKLNREFESQMSRLRVGAVSTKENAWGAYTSPLELLSKVQDYPLESTHHFQDRLAKYGEKGLPDLHLSSLSRDAIITVNVDSEIISKSLDPEGFKQCVAAAGEAIVQVMGSLTNGSDTEVVRAISDISFSDPEGKNYESGSSLLYHVEDVAGTARGAVVSRRVSRKRAVRIVREALKAEVQTQEQDLFSVIPKELHVPSGALFLALCALNNQQNTTKAFNAFEVRLKKAMESDTRVPVLKKAPLNVFQQVVELGLGNSATVDVQNISINYLTDLLHQICVRSFDGDINRIIQELEQHRDPEFVQQTESRRAVLTHIFEQVVPALEARYRRQLTCQVPDSIKMTPYGHQRDAAVGAAFLEKPIMVMEPGTGKTLSLATAVEMLGGEGGLWVTKPAVREQTRSHLNNDIFNDKKVRVISSLDARKSLTEFCRILESADYLVIGYDSIRVLHNKSPEAFSALNNWLSSRRCILDEAHLIDKRTSGKSKAVLALTALRVIVASGTPYQHDDARVATLLHVVRPDIFPDPVSLETFFHKNPGAARTTLHAYSTVFSIEDVALPFEDPKKIPFAEQLRGGIPRVPTMVTHRSQYTLSPEHSATYIDLMLNSEQWAKAHHSQVSDNRRAIHLRRLVSYPEQLGLSRPEALLDAVKKIALPIVERGEKVLVLSFRKHPLHLLAKDPEMRSYGAVALDGDQSIDERTKLVTALEEDASIQIGLGQMSAVGSGFNIRSVSCVIVLDRPLQSSELYQALRRPIRLLGAGDERFARQIVDVHFLEADLDHKTLRMLSTEERAALGDETIYKKLLSRSLHDLERFRSFVVRGESGTSAQPSLEAIISKLAASHQRATEQLNAHQLMSERVAAGRVAPSVLRYNTPAKNRWRAEELGAFVSENIQKLGRPIDQLQVVVLAGPEGLEIPIYTELGIPASNIHVFEGSKNKEWQSAVREMAHAVGAPFYASAVERVLPFMDKKFDIVSIDPDGYTTPALALMFALLPMNDIAMILKNTMASREKGEAKEMISEVDYRRDLVDAKIVKLLGTKSLAELDSLSAVGLIREVSRVRAIARTLAPLICRDLKVQAETAQEFLVELAIGAPHTKALKQGRYITPGGTPFHHTFALVERWSTTILDSALAKEVQSLFSALKLEVGVVDRITAPILSAEFQALVRTEGPRLIKYFELQAPQPFWLGSIV